jgi:hypothetical protein
MVVPRVPKRPGEVVGIGSSSAGITRRISGSDEINGSDRSKPPLPPRSSKELEREEKKDTDAVIVVPPEDAADSHPESHHTSGKKIAKANATEVVARNTSEPEPSLPVPSSDMTRSDSAPASTVDPSALPMRSLDPDVPSSEIVNDTGGLPRHISTLGADKIGEARGKGLAVEQAEEEITSDQDDHTAP